MIASDIYFLICASKLSFSSKKHKNLNNLAFLPLTNLIACSIQYIGSKLLMMLQLLQVLKKTISLN